MRHWAGSVARSSVHPLLWIVHKGRASVASEATDKLGCSRMAITFLSSTPTVLYTDRRSLKYLTILSVSWVFTSSK